MKSNRIITFLSLLVFCVTFAFAQSSGDKLYNQGLQLQKTMTISAQNQAIAKFNSAKKLYDSAVKKQQCDQAITVSRNIINAIKDGVPKKDDAVNEEEKVQPTLEISEKSFDFSPESQSFKVMVVTNQPDWTVKPLDDGKEQFVSARKDGNNIDFWVTKNDTYEKRTQKFIVKAANLQQEIEITQNGKHVQLFSSESALNFKSGGGKKQLEVSCSSEQVFPSNSNANWYVESKPDWVSVTINTKSEQKGLLGKIKNKTKQILNGKEDINIEGVEKTPVTIQAQAIPKGSKIYAQGRHGEIKIVSGDSSVTIYVTQANK